MEEEEYNWRIPGILGLVSCVGSLCVILSYASLTALRKHPSIMVLFLSICDLMYSLKFALECHDLVPKGWCINSALWGNFWGMASISWNAMLSVNIISTLYDPFKGTASFLVFYHVFVWCMASSTTIILYFNSDHLGRVEDEYICGVKDRDDHFQLMFFIPLCTYIMLGFWCLGLSIRRMSTLKNPSLYRSSQRRSLMSRVILVVCVFTVVWTVPATTRLLSFIRSEDTKELEFFLFFDLCSLGFQGFMNALVWLTNPTFVTAVQGKFKRLRSVLKRKLVCGPRLDENSFLVDSPPGSPMPPSAKGTPLMSSQSLPSFEAVLRTDIISCLLFGIQDSATGKTQDCSQFNEAKEFPELIDASQSAHSEKKNGFHFLDYYPTVFASIRAADGITSEMYLESLDVEKFIRHGNFKISDARSGAFFCIPPDKQYILKMVSNVEADFLKTIIPNLASYYKTERHTLLVKFYGFHGVTLPQGYTVHIVVMSNVFHSGVKLDHVYDLKGSWVNRKSRKASLGLDLDFSRKINFTEDIKVLFLGQISKDATFLSSLGLMDYSLILGMHLIKDNDSFVVPTHTGSNQQSPWTKGLLSDDQTEVYYLGIIDFLQRFNWRKRLEFFFKTKLLCKDSKGLSAVPPHEYCNRFLKAMQNKLVQMEESVDYQFVIVD